GSPLPVRWWKILRAAVGEVADWLRASFAADGDRLFLWAPVAVAAGVALYFSLDFEPPAWPAPLALMLAGIALWRLRNRPALALCAATVFCLLLGFGASVLRTYMVTAPVLQRATSGTLVAE